MQNEVWKDIDGYEDMYKISNKGRVMSLARKSPKEYRGNLTVNEKILKQSNRGGYCRATLCKRGECKRFSVHRLVAQAFIPNPENKAFINHKDGDKKNNNVNNLEWVTSSENQKHAYDNNLCDRKGENSSDKLTNEDVLEIRATKNLGCFSDREIAQAYDVSRRCINHIVNRDTWRHI